MCRDCCKRVEWICRVKRSYCIGQQESAGLHEEVRSAIVGVDLGTASRDLTTSRSGGEEDASLSRVTVHLLHNRR